MKFLMLGPAVSGLGQADFVFAQRCGAPCVLALFGDPNAITANDYQRGLGV
jgi:hypothetical protein